ncbi:MAG: hypothetical protein ABI873_13395 [Marmoricola sp.]
MDGPAVSATTVTVLRAEVRRFVTECGTRRALPTRVHVGELAGDRMSIHVDAWYDVGLRADLLTRALDHLGEPAGLTAWLTRGGYTTACDHDLVWLAAADMAFGRHGVARVAIFAVTRHGWLDVRTGEVRSWRRVRPLKKERGQLWSQA